MQTVSKYMEVTSPEGQAPPRLVRDLPLTDLEDIEFAFLDLDGTSLNKAKIPSNGFWIAVEAFEASGGKVVTATGNARDAAMSKIQKDDATGTRHPADNGGASFFSSGADLTRLPGIYQNGAEVRGQDGTEISETWLSNSATACLAEWFHKLSSEQRELVGLAFQSYGDVYILAAPSPETEVPRAWAAARGDRPKVCSLEKWSRAPYYWGEGWAQALPYSALKDVLSKGQIHCAMIVTTFDDQAFWANDALTALGDHARNLTHSSALTDADPFNRSAYVFTHRDASKGNGLRLLLQEFGCTDTKRAVAMGDNLNDKSMFLVDGVLGIAVENAHVELKAVARAVSGSPEHPEVGGVAQALNRITEARKHKLTKPNIGGAPEAKRMRSE